jgi:CRISPR-associated protein Csb3
VDWFQDDFSGGSRFKTWAGQQSVLDIAQSMHDGAKSLAGNDADVLWRSVRGMGLPFNFDSDLGGQGTALDIGFSFDPLAGSETTRIEGSCKPWLELLCFVGFQRFRPREIKGANRFVYTAWNTPLQPNVAAVATCQAIELPNAPAYEFRLLYRTKYLKSFLSAQPFLGDRDE